MGGTFTFCDLTPPPTFPKVDLNSGLISLGIVFCVSSGINEKEKVEVTIYPNPSNGQFHVEATLADHASGVATLEILNVMNQSVHSQEVPVIDGRVSATVDAIQLVQDGMYYLRLSSVNKHYYSQMIIAQ